jgi:DNA-binding transcriptional ArsR family regulator
MPHDADPLSPALSRTEFTRLRSRAGDAAALLKALSNANRLLILCTLAGGELSVSDLNRSVDLSQSALSQQLGVLRRQRLVVTRREAQTIYYSLAPSNASAIIEVLRKLYCGTGSVRGKRIKAR